MKKNFCHCSGQNQVTKCRTWRLRDPLRLQPRAAHATFSLPSRRIAGGYPQPVIVHRYEQHIAGRLYRIEVSAISASRWRAEIARRPGMPTAMMPFYGQTPDEAAEQLSRWLTMVYNGTSKQ